MNDRLLVSGIRMKKAAEGFADKFKCSKSASCLRLILAILNCSV